MAARTIARRYRLSRPLGRGGMAEVWLADDVELGRNVAIKLLHEDADRERFAREARAAAALAHPHICRLFDYGEDRGQPFMVFECLPGGTLDDRLRPGEPLPDDEVEAVAADVATGLAHAHARGIVHRDLKPANILFDAEGRAKIADFGIARLEGSAPLTEHGTVLGTAVYLSPEQAAGEPATPAGDSYAFGVILYRMLAGRPPFEAGNPLALAELHRDAVPPPLSTLRTGAPPRLESLALACLAKSPADRPADGEALRAELGLEETAAAAVLERPTELRRITTEPAATVPTETEAGTTTAGAPAP